MVTEQQVRRLFMLNEKEKSKAIAAAKAGMDPKTARKYIKIGKLPSQIKCRHDWRSRKDPFEKDWPEILEMLEISKRSINPTGGVRHRNRCGQGASG